MDRDLVAKSCGVSVVLTQDPAQPLATLHSAVTATAMSEPADEVRKLLYRVIDLLQPLQSVDVSGRLAYLQYATPATCGA